MFLMKPHTGDDENIQRFPDVAQTIGILIVVGACMRKQCVPGPTFFFPALLLGKKRDWERGHYNSYTGCLTLTSSPSVLY